MRHFRLFVVFIGTLLTATATAQQYNLFHPVPKTATRDMETDRPNLTESPYTIDAGHFQYETDVVKFERIVTNDAKDRTWSLNEANIKVGLLSNTSMQLSFETYAHQVITDRVTQEKQTSRGFGNIAIRFKQNLLGNDGGKWAVAILPYVQIPTAVYEEDHRYEYGLLLPVQIALPHDWKLGLQTEADELRDDGQKGMHFQLLQTLAISHPLVKKVDALAETHLTYDCKHHELHNYLNAAVQWEVADNVKLDTGINFGLQAFSARNVFLGCSFRW